MEIYYYNIFSIIITNVLTYLDHKEISQFIHLHIYTYILSEMYTILALHKTHKKFYFSKFVELINALKLIVKKYQ